MTADLAAYCLYLESELISHSFEIINRYSRLTRLTLVTNHSIRTLVGDVVILVSEGTGPILVEQYLEVVVLTALIVV